MTLFDRPTAAARNQVRPTAHTELGKTCICADPQVDHLRDLVTQGVPQMEASRQLWGTPDLVPPSPPRFRWIGARERSC